MNRKNKGFTLIELLAVIVVLAIIMVIATMQVNKQIKKSRKNANEINKKQIQRAVKTCLLESSDDECDTIEKLQTNGYLDYFEDPWDKENKDLDSSYAIIIDEEKINAKVIYFGEGITQEVEAPPKEYFSWCNNEHTCTDGLTGEGKKWLQSHDDILIIPDSIRRITNCSSDSKDCNDFSDIKIDALIISNDKTTDIAGKAFNGASINVVKIDSFNNRYLTFQGVTINKLIIGNLTKELVNICEHSFKNSKLNYVKIENAKLSFEIFPGSIINTLILGDNVISINGNAFSGVPINNLIIYSNELKSVGDNPFRAGKINTITIKTEVNKLPFNSDVSERLIANNNPITNGRYESVGNLIIEGDKTRFSIDELYNMGFNCNVIMNALSSDSNNSDNIYNQCIDKYKITTEKLTY